ncbi:MAG: hypothetical protein ACO1OF_16390 [Adhaeribacter sp.]
MAHNFKITNALRWMSKAGADTNAGTMDAPKKTLSGMLNGGSAGSYVIGAGQYNDQLGGTFSGVGYTFYADGKVVFRNTGTFLQNSAYRPSTWVDITFEDFAIAFNQSALCLIRCICRNTTLISNCHNPHDSSIYINTHLQRRATDVQATRYLNCLWVKGGSADLRFGSSDFYVNNCYFSPTTPIVTDRPALFNKCNIQSTSITVNGVEYASLAAAKAVDATWFPNCISADPKFVNPETDNYTLRPESPHLALGIGPTHLRLGNGYYLKGAVGPVSATSNHYFEDIISGEQFPIYQATNLIATLQSGQLRLKVKEAVGGSFTGSFKIALKTSDVTIQLGRNNFVSGLNFNTDYPAAENLFNPNSPEVLNNNVPNKYNWSSGHEGRNPNRLDYAMRWSTKDNPAIATETDWITGNNYLIFEWDTIPVYNPVSGKGNADPDFQTNPANTQDAPFPILCNWIDMEITLMNNYYSK